MSKYYKIRYFEKKRQVFPPVGYIPSPYFRERIIELAGEGVLPGWDADEGNIIGPGTKDQLKGLDGKIIDIPQKWAQKWGLTEKTWVSEGLMDRLDELWPLIEMHNVHKITYPIGDGKFKDDYANSKEVIKSIKEELPSGTWKCELITVENESELKKLQGGDDGCERVIRGTVKDGKRSAFRNVGDNCGSTKEGGDDGWCGKELHAELLKALKQVRSGRVRTGESITEDTGTEQVENAAKDTVEDTVEGTAKEQIEDRPEGKVEDKVGDKIEDTAEGTAEDPVQGIVEDAAAPSKELSECKIT
ncbi:hypothetical protein J4E80_005501 [Alternaria sp. BMP 0032]|nr:hypothetical protein J4E80_005501 [Alternaria sp. BMP 0032]